MAATPKPLSAHAAFPEGSESAEVKMAGLLKKSGVLDEDAANLMDIMIWNTVMDQ